MEYRRFDLQAYNLHIIKTDKFKTITVDVNMRRIIKKEEITIRKLLANMLVRSTKNLDSQRKMEMAKESLYNLGIYGGNSRFGNYNNFYLTMYFLNEKYTELGMNSKSLDFMMDILFNPDLENNKFNDQKINLAKRRVEESIKSIKDNMIKYSIVKMLEKMDDSPLSYNEYGNLDDLKKITNEDLVKYYKSILNNDVIDIFVVGDVDFNEIKSYFQEHFKVNTIKRENKNPILDERPNRSRIKRSTLKEEVSQSKLSIGCRINGLSFYERFYVLKIFNGIFGGNSNSKLFSSVREKNSLAYYIDSDPKSYDNLLLIYAGINKKDNKQVITLIKKALTEMVKGKFTEEEITATKQIIISAIKTMADYPDGIIGNYFSRVLVNTDDFETRKQKIMAVTKQDIINVAKKVKIDTIFLLEGSDEIETNSNE